MAKINRHDKGASELFNLVDNLEPFYYQEKNQDCSQQTIQFYPNKLQKMIEWFPVNGIETSTEITPDLIAGLSCGAS